MDRLIYEHPDYGRGQIYVCLFGTAFISEREWFYFIGFTADNGKCSASDMRLGKWPYDEKGKAEAQSFLDNFIKDAQSERAM